VPKSEIAAVGAEAFKDLAGEFTSGGKHECPWHAWRVWASAAALSLLFLWFRHSWTPALCKHLQHGHGKSSCFAGAGLGAPEHIMARENDGNCLCLDRGGRFVALVSCRANDGLSEPKFREVHFQIFLLGFIRIFTGFRWPLIGLSQPMSRDRVRVASGVTQEERLLSKTFCQPSHAFYQKQRVMSNIRSNLVLKQSLLLCGSQYEAVPSVMAAHCFFFQASIIWGKGSSCVTGKNE
jgi:hypothetical protein